MLLAYPLDLSPIQMEAKVIMSRLLQTFKFALSEDYVLKLVNNITLQPRDGVLCTVEYA